MDSVARTRRRQRTGSRAGTAESAGRRRQSDCGSEVRPVPFPAPADADEMDPQELGEKDRLDAGTRRRKARRRRLDGSGRKDRGGLSGEEFFNHHAKGRSQWPPVANAAAGCRRQVYRRGFRGAESRCSVARRHGGSAGHCLGEPAQRVQDRKIRSQDV